MEMNARSAKIVYDHTKFIESLKSDINEKLILITALEAPVFTFEDAIVRKYIETKSTKKVAEYLKEIGEKRSATANYTAQDISTIIQNSCKNVKEPVSFLAMQIFNNNYKSVLSQYG